ncbi:MAG: excinuclease ABC subunit UvrC [Treponema sp.]|jgi:excinuclease ABC subunit C|nr:excinuclease ABC subunit UvrC [Treponema sp.]
MNQEEQYEALKASVRDTPTEPGVYIMRDGENRIIYVGKARVLRNRLRTYFSGPKDVKTATLIARVAVIETIIVANEYEALLLENTLIKQHSPKYNINLKDGKTYPVIRLTSETFPRIFRTRHIINDGSRYFGPFPNVSSVDLMLEVVERLFSLRKCRRLRKRTMPCIYYHIERCMGPCCGRISAADYQLQVEQAQKILAGETESLLVELTATMHKAARKLRFEEAAQLRNAIRALEDIGGGERAVVDFDPGGRDYIAWAAEGVFRTFTVFSMRGGKMTGREVYRTRSAADDGESLETFIAAYYTPDRPPPPWIYLPEEYGQAEPELLTWFTETFGTAPVLLPPQEKRHQAVLAMARQNALEDLRKRLKERGAGPALDELARALGLKTRPERIEGFDIAQLDGVHPVASLISFKNGVPDRKNYRCFKLRSVVGVVDDFAAMREAVYRRYSRLIREGNDLPDLILVDGGIGQANAAKGILDELELDIDVAGLAKRDEELWLPRAKEPIRLSRDSEALKVLQFVRDETHRFATSFNQRLRSKDLFFPALESVEGIGPKRAAALMKAYTSLENIAAAPPEEMAVRCKIGSTAALAVRAAARLALEDREAAKKRLEPRASSARRKNREEAAYAPSSSADTGALLAAEASREYPGDEDNTG